MATVNKNFKIKQGLIVEGTEATVNGNDILTKKQADQDYIVNLAGGGASTSNEPNKVVKRDANGDFSAGTIHADLVGDVTGDLNGNADTATALQTPRTIELTGDITGSVSFDGTSNVQIATSIDADFATDAEVATAKSEAISDAHSYTDGKISDEVTARNSAIATAKSEAISTASTDATTKANAAEASAKSYTDDEISALDLSLKAYTDQAESDVMSALSTHEADQTNIHGIADTSKLVTTDGTQTLTNKTIDTGTFNNKQSFNTNSTGTDAAATFTMTNGNTGNKLVDFISTSGVSAAYIGNGGSFRTSSWLTSGTTSPSAQLTVTGNAAQSIGVGTTYPLVKITGVASQTNDMLQVKKSDGTTVTTIDKDGNINITSGSYKIGSTEVLSSTQVLGKSLPSGTIVGDTDAQTLSNKTLGTDLDANGNKVKNLGTPTANADAATKAYVDNKVSDLVDGAPALLDTLNELAAAIADNPNYATDVTNLVATKADTTYVNSEIADLDTAAQGYASTAQATAETFATNADSTLYTTVTGDIATAKSAAEVTAQGYANTAESHAISTASADATQKANAAQAAAEATASADATQKANAAQAAANTYTNTAITQEVADRNSAISGAISTEITNRNTAINAAIGQEVADRDSAITLAISNLNTSVGGDLDAAIAQEVSDRNSAISSVVNALDTDAIEEGVNHLYFTESRAQAAVAGNIQTAVTNAVDAINTDSIEEGLNNLYFTNQRALDAVGGDINNAIAAGNSSASPTYQEINFTWATKQIGTYTWVPNSGVATVYQWNGNSFPAAKFLVRVREGQHSQVSEVLVTKDDNGNVAITEYAIVHTNGILGDISAEFANGTYSLTVNAVNNSTEVIVSGMLLAYGD